jgi:hypothetical protein
MTTHLKIRVARAAAVAFAAAILSVHVAPAEAQRATFPALPAAFGGDPVFVGAGDIADCTTVTDSATAALLDGIDGTVFTAGDNVYPFGRAIDFTTCYEPVWGRHRTRTRPSPGNHDYLSPGAAPYYAYFGTHAGAPGVGYYSYNIGAWHIVALNSNVPVNAGSAQEQWLRADLAAHWTACTLAYWHHPLFSSGEHGNNLYMRDIWQALSDFGADVVITGHDHDYEQFHRQDANGVPDENGIREFVVGTGGTSLRAFGVIQPNSAVRESATHGVLKLTLHPASYHWQFIPIAGESFTDAGSRACVGTAPAAIGGRSLALGTTAAGGVEMAWTVGTAQSSYAIARIAGGTTVLPWFLPAAATQHVDAAPLSGQINCYTALPLGASGLLALSDLLCSAPGTGSASGGPSTAHIQLDQSNMATLTWSPPMGQTGYQVVVIPLDGTPRSSFSLTASAMRTMHDTGGRPTCYVIVAMSGAAATGYSDALCAVPGISTLP